MESCRLHKQLKKNHKAKHVKFVETLTVSIKLVEVKVTRVRKMQNSRTTSIQVSQSPVSHFYQKVQPKGEEKTEKPVGLQTAS